MQAAQLVHGFGVSVDFERGHVVSWWFIVVQRVARTKGLLSVRFFLSNWTRQIEEIVLTDTEVKSVASVGTRLIIVSIQW